MKFTSIGLLLCMIAACDVPKKAKVETPGEKIAVSSLIGVWRSESDSAYVLVFERDRCFELYEKDTTDIMRYWMSVSCDAKDSSTEVALQNAYILFNLNGSDTRQCNEVLNFQRNFFSWMNTENGKISSFIKK